jgi:hypothetical protein
LQKLFLASVTVLKAEWGMANSIGMPSKDLYETGVNLHVFPSLPSPQYADRHRAVHYLAQGKGGFDAGDPWQTGDFLAVDDFVILN